jgi:uncharacterized protein (TIGR02231 family)
MDAPIVAVVVYPAQARVTRRGTLELPAGEHRVVLDGLPVALVEESVRVSGRGAATVSGVDVLLRTHAEAPEEVARELADRRRALARRLAELDDAAAVEAARRSFLDTVAQKAGAGAARALTSGVDQSAGAARVAAVGAALAAELAGLAGRRRDIAERQERAQDQLAALEREIAGRRKQNRPDRRAVAVTLLVEEPGGTVELEVSYVVGEASWTSVYDARLSGEAVSLTWYGLVRQRTGEDWPECDLRCSTARPTAAASVPELRPWYVDEYRPPQPVYRVAAADSAMVAGAVPAAPGSAAQPQMTTMAAPPRQALAAAAASVEPQQESATAVTYRLARPVAVPADGAPHRATVAVLDLEARLDHITVPKIAPEAHLRATVVNSSAHTLPPGRAAVFHAADFVGAAKIGMLAPGEETELALGVDDRIRVERELTRRATGRAMLGGNRRIDVAFTITVANHTGRPARVTVSDQLPVPRHEAISVRDVKISPEPAERTDLGVLTWKLDIAAGGKAQIVLSFRLEHPRDLVLSGWGDGT